METAARPRAAQPTQLLAWAALVTVWILWGSTYLGIRVAVETIPPFLMAGIRYIIAGGILTGAMLIWKPSLLPSVSAKQGKSLALVAFLLLVCGNGGLCFAETRIASGVAALIVATVPIWMLVIDAILDRKALHPWAIAGLALGTLGIAALVGLHFGTIPVGPAIIVLFSAFAWAVGSVYARRNGDSHNNPLLPALEMVVGGVMLTVVGLLFGEAGQLHIHAISRPSILGFLWLVGPGAIVGYTAYGYAVRTLPTRTTATYAYVNPVVAVILGALMIGEPITLNVLIGGSAVVVSVIAILLSRSR